MGITTARCVWAGVGVVLWALLSQAVTGETVACVGPFAGNTELSRPVAVAVDADRKVYVLDRKDYAVKVFDSAGKLLTKLVLGKKTIPVPKRMAVSPDGSRIYITDWHGHVVVAVDAAGKLQNRWGGRGQTDGQFMFPGPIAIGAHGRVFVADQGMKRVQEFTPEGKHLKSFLIANPSKDRADSKRLGVVGISVWPDGAVSSLLRHDELGLGMIYTLDATGELQSRTSHWYLPEPTCMVALGDDRMLVGSAKGDVTFINKRTQYGKTIHLRQEVGTIFDMALLGQDRLLVVDTRGHRLMECRIAAD
jgi:DNA-binding beta-propeller fold protein YncE